MVQFVCKPASPGQAEPSKPNLKGTLPHVLQRRVLPQFEIGQNGCRILKESGQNPAKTFPNPFEILSNSSSTSTAAEIKAHIETAERELEDSRVDCQTALREQIDAIEPQRLRRVLDDFNGGPFSLL